MVFPLGSANDDNIWKKKVLFDNRINWNNAILNL